VYSLACVLYEMLTGEPPYQGSTAQAVLGKIIQGDPVSATVLRSAVPPHVDAAIRKALERLPADRFASAQAFVRALGDPSFRHGGTMGRGVSTSLGAGTPISRFLATTTVLLLAVAGWALTRGPGQPEVRRHVLAEMWGGQDRPIGAYTALAPDGSAMVFARLAPGGSNRQLHYKASDAAESIVLSGTDQAQNVVYAPDGDRIAFAVGTSIKTRSVPDGVTLTVAQDAFSQMIGLAWMDDGTILYEVENQTVVRIPELGGTPDTVAVWPDAQQLSFIGPIEGSRGALVNLCPANCQAGVELHVIDLRAGETRLLLDDVIRAWALPTGHLMYVRGDRRVFAAPFDRRSLTLTGAAIPLFEGVDLLISTPELTVGADGTLMYRTAAPTLGSREVVWVDRTGAVTPVALPLDLYDDVSVAPTGDRLAISTVDGANPGLWVKQLPDGPLTRITAAGDLGGRADWSSDGERLAFVEASDEAWETRTDGSVGRTLLLSDERGVREVQHLGEAGRYLVRVGTGPTARLGVAEAGADSVTLLLDPDYSMRMGRVSPDGRWLAYVSVQSGTPQVYVRPFPDLNGQVQISTGEGYGPVWNPSGRELFFHDAGVFSSVSYEDDPFFRVTGRTAFFTLSDLRFWAPGTEWRPIDVAPDGQRFVLLRSAAQLGAAEEVASEIVLVEGFFTELEERFRR
jgi:serine/threonine-protein kinase